MRSTSLPFFSTKALFVSAVLGAYIPLAAAAATTNLTVTVGGETFAEHSFNFSSGGTYTFNTQANNSSVITFPTDFYSESLNLRANSYSKTFFEANKPAPSGKNFVGKTYDFDLFTASGSQVTAVNKAVTISFTYTDADISGMDKSTLAPYRRESGDSSWQLISGSTIDTTNNKVTFSTSLFSSFALLAAPAPSSSPSPTPSPASSGGGGGGGGYIATPETAAVFSGRAYPKSTVTLLKDAQIAATAIAGSDANFSMKISGLSGGNYIFAMYSEDSQGNRSSLLTFPVSVTSGATSYVSGIFIAPTIATDKSEVKRGDNIAIFGQSVPSGEITVAISSDEEFFGKTIADQSGAYLYNFDTSNLDMGQHFTKSKTARDGAISSFSKAVGFTVGTKNIFAQLTKTPTKGDLNGDKRVNLVDFSIAAYWYKRTNPPASSDLNGDGKVDLIDFSIMAFYWTG